MFLRPGEVFKEFTLETCAGDVNIKGRPTKVYAAAEPAVIINGALADATPDEKERWKQTSHPITHNIVQKGAPKAKEGDRLTRDGRHFYIQGIDDPGSLHQWTIYRVEERRDA